MVYTFSLFESLIDCDLDIPEVSYSLTSIGWRVLLSIKTLQNRSTILYLGYLSVIIYTNFTRNIKRKTINSLNRDIKRHID